MADTLTLLQLRTSVRQRANMEGSTFCSDAEINGYINQSYKELHDLIVDAVEDYLLSTDTFTLTTTNIRALPTSFYKMRGLDDTTNFGRPRSVRKYNWNERNDWSYGQAAYLDERFSDVTYRIVGTNLQIMPSERAARSYALYYVPIATDLAADVDVAQSINGWLEYVVVDAAMKCLIKEESDIRPLQAMKKAMFDRIEALKRDRDQGLPEKISRVRTRRRNRYGVDDENYPL
jgi:hypothetical protein